MKKFILFLSFIAVFLSCFVACDTDPYKNKRPIIYENSYWVCYEYDACFRVGTPYELTEAVISIHGQQLPFTFLWAKFYPIVTIIIDVDGEEQRLGGECKFGKREFTIFIEDTHDLFDTQSVEMHFERVE